MSLRMRLGLALAGSSAVSIALFLLSGAQNNTFTEVYLIWNLGLAWVPLLFILWLQRLLRTRLWSGWQPLAITIVWLSFLPNSFYMITDLIHLHEIERTDMLFDLVMFTSFVMNGVMLGYLSLFLVHLELIKRLSRRVSALIISGVLLLASFAIFIGRDLRWNTWDVVLNPASVIFDVSDRLINPGAHPQVFSTTASFFVLLASTYVVVWYMLRAARTQVK